MSATAPMSAIPSGIFPIIFLIIVFTLQNKIYSQSGFVSKNGGICFRIDDNKPISSYLQFADVFNRYNQHFCFAINFGSTSINEDYIKGLKQLEAEGHEIMDHTPQHGTNYFTSVLSTDYFLNHPGVYEVTNTKRVLLKYCKPDISSAKRSGYATINKDTVRGSFTNFKIDDCYLYFPDLDKLLFIHPVRGWIDENTVKVVDFWQNSVNLGSHQNIKYYNFDPRNIHLTIEAVKALIEESVRLADYYKLERPKTWIQPGTYSPHLHSNEIKTACDNLGYKCADAFQPAYKVFNEYNPNNDKQFGMGWGNFDEDEWDFNKCREVIADKIAKHHVLIGSGHFSDLPDGWSGFLSRTDQLVRWCCANNIPIKTYSEWADILYNHLSDPDENIIPPLDTDLDENSVPDGYNKSVEGTISANDGPPGSGNSSYAINKKGIICSITGLGGVEKGKNDFEIWTKGSTGNFIEVLFKAGTQNLVYKFPSETSEWTKYNLEQSVNGCTILDIPENISLIDITVSCSDYNYGTVKIGGMSLTKNGPLPVELSSFTASIEQNKVRLKWKTITEINNYGFEIERASSSNAVCQGIQWEKIGFVEGNGNCNSTNDYFFVDINPSPGNKFIYRLKQIDSDGKFEYSHEVEAELFPDQFILNQNYPNPFNPETRIKFELPERSFVKLIIFDQLGNEIIKLEDSFLEPGYYEKKWIGNNSGGMPVSSGIYICRFYGKGESSKEYNKTIKMIMMK